MRTNAHFSFGIRTPRYDTAPVRVSAYIVISSSFAGPTLGFGMACFLDCPLTEKTHRDFVLLAKKHVSMVLVLLKS